MDGNGNGSKLPFLKNGEKKIYALILACSGLIVTASAQIFKSNALETRVAVSEAETKTVKDELRYLRDWFVMGLCFGMGFAIAGAVLHFIVMLLSGAK